VNRLNGAAAVLWLPRFTTPLTKGIAHPAVSTPAGTLTPTCLTCCDYSSDPPHRQTFIGTTLGGYSFTTDIGPSQATSIYQDRTAGPRGGLPIRAQRRLLGQRPFRPRRSLSFDACGTGTIGTAAVGTDL
jgi:hypothetical protein